VLTAGADWQEISHAKFDEDFYATPAIVDGRIFARTTESLYCFGFPDIEGAVAARMEEARRESTIRRTTAITLVGCLGVFSIAAWSWLSRRRKASRAGRHAESQPSDETGHED
jgi:hypothetical protein